MRLNPTLPAILLSFLLLSCSSLQQSATLGVLAESGARVGTAYRLAAHPEEKPAFQVAVQALSSLIDANDYDPVKFAEALKALPINQLDAKNGSVYISVAVVIWDAVAQQARSLDTPADVKMVMIAVRDGLRAGIAVS